MKARMTKDYLGLRAGKTVEVTGGLGDVLVRRGFATLPRKRKEDAKLENKDNGRANSGAGNSRGSKKKR